MSDPQFQYSYMPHTQVQYTEQRAYVQPPYMGPSTSHLSPDPGFPEEYSPTNPTFHQPSSYQTPHHSYGYETPNTQFPFYPTHSQSTYTDEDCYSPQIEPNPQPQRPSYENMGTRLYETGTTSNVNLFQLRIVTPNNIKFIQYTPTQCHIAQTNHPQLHHNIRMIQIHTIRQY